MEKLGSVGGDGCGWAPCPLPCPLTCGSCSSQGPWQSLAEQSEQGLSGHSPRL